MTTTAPPPWTPGETLPGMQRLIAAGALVAPVVAAEPVEKAEWMPER
jgi:hypothetical protein